MLFYIFHHFHHLDVGTAMAGAFQGTDAGADGGVGVCSCGGEHSCGESRSVTAAVLRMKHKRKIEYFRFKMRIFSALS